MALTTILRRSVLRASVFAGRLISGERHYHCHSYISPLRTAVYRNVVIPSSSVSSYRRYSASPAVIRPSSDESLLKVIESEIDCAIESQDSNEVQEAPEGFPFEIEDNPGQQTMSLSANLDGETINVAVYMPNLSTAEDNDDDNNDDNNNDDNNNDDEDENSSKFCMSLVVRLNKSSGPVLEFGCTAYPDEIVIDSLSVKDPDSFEDPLDYQGPDFWELDEDLQKALHEYLAVRGIKPSVTNYIYEYLLNKDSKEYLMWLKNLKEFLQA